MGGAERQGALFVEMCFTWALLGMLHATWKLKIGKKNPNPTCFIKTFI